MKPVCFLVAVLATVAVAQQPADPWSKSDLIQPEAVAARLNETQGPKPVILYTGFPVLYRSSHIPGAPLAGPASKPAGIDALHAIVANVAHDTEIIIYCGCCPFTQCPNIRPAYSELKKMGFTKVRVLPLPENFSKDWIDKGYPVERPRAAARR